MGVLKRIAAHGAAGLLPAVAWFVGCILYFLTTAPLERFTDIRVPYNQILMSRILALLAGSGGVTGILIGFLRERRHFGFVQRYLLLFGFGSLVPVLASLIQYHWYRAEPSQFSFSDSAQDIIGQNYTEFTERILIADLRRAAAYENSARAILSTVRDGQVLAYIDAADRWRENGQCRRLDLGHLSHALCVERETISTRHGTSYSYWPVIRTLTPYDPVAPLRADLFLLTGPFRCPVPNDLLGGGGFNFLRHEKVDGGKLRACINSLVKALESQRGRLSHEVALVENNVIMPYWYFLCGAVFSFVGTDFALVEPVGLWPVFLGGCDCDIPLLVLRRHRGGAPRS